MCKYSVACIYKSYLVAELYHILHQIKNSVPFFRQENLFDGCIIFIDEVIEILIERSFQKSAKNFPIDGMIAISFEFSKRRRKACIKSIPQSITQVDIHPFPLRKFRLRIAIPLRKRLVFVIHHVRSPCGI